MKGEQEKRLGLTLQVRWAVGPVTPGWEELWRRILSDVLGGQDDVANRVTKGLLAAGPTLGMEDEFNDAG